MWFVPFALVILALSVAVMEWGARQDDAREADYDARLRAYGDRKRAEIRRKVRLGGHYPSPRSR